MISRGLLLLLLLVSGCRMSEDDKSAIWTSESNGKVTELSFSSRILSSIDSAGIFVKGASDPVMGNFELRDGSVIFTPAIHLSPGQTYELKKGEKVILLIELPGSDTPVPKLLNIYPSGDSIAENTLKMYFRFSEPMMEGNSSKYVHVLRNDRDTMKGTFLDLQPELWNEDGTILTLWLDPGRIKRDLIPNKTLGNPLTAGSTYKVIVAPGWKSKEAVPATERYEKTYVCMGRDEKSPDPDAWSIAVPTSGSRNALKIGFGESLDYMLVMNAIHVSNANGEMIEGAFESLADERGVEFIPLSTWVKGKYTIEIESRLEDLAGNNLTRLFDQDIKTGTQKEVSKPALIPFEVF